MIFIVVSAIIGLLAIAALISATETAITATSPGKIQQLKSEGNIRANIVLGILKIKDKVISTLLIGNSIANTVCTTIATGLFIELLGDEIGTLVSSIVMSFVIIVFSEVIPKAIAVAKPEKMAIFATPTLKIFLKILSPINFILGYVVKGFCFIFRIDLTPEIYGTDEVRGVIEHQMNEGNVYKDDRDMLGGILDIRNMIVSDIMVHRSNVFAIDINLEAEEIVENALLSSHTRIPIWEENPDNIIGILHIRDLLNAIHANKSKEINIQKLLADPIFVPDNALLTQQLKNFREGHSHLACVINEYGDFQGIITLEDILEEIVGQIYDEHDPAKRKIMKNADNEYIIDGLVTIRDLNRELNWQFPENDATTLAGLMINKMERIPNQGEYLIVKDFKLLVSKKSANRIKTIKVIIQENKGK